MQLVAGKEVLEKEYWRKSEFILRDFLGSTELSSYNTKVKYENNKISKNSSLGEEAREEWTELLTIR